MNQIRIVNVPQMIVGSTVYNKNLGIDGIITKIYTKAIYSKI